MEDTILLQPEKMLDDDSLSLASGVFMAVNRTIRDVHIIVSALLHYAMIGASITNSLTRLRVHTPEED